jgi:hypothetical protein
VIVVTPDDVSDVQSLVLSNCTNCAIVVIDSAIELHAIQLNNMNKCSILVKPIDGSILVESCKDCVFAMGGQQVSSPVSGSETPWFCDSNSLAVLVSNAYEFECGVVSIRYVPPHH